VGDIITSKCRKCNVTVIGLSRWCINCYWRHTVACGACKKMTNSGSYINKRDRNGVPLMKNCKQCGGTGWLTKE
jgi:hypothetical protein